MTTTAKTVHRPRVALKLAKRFPDLITDELNVKTVRFHDPTVIPRHRYSGASPLGTMGFISIPQPIGPLLRESLRLNKKAAATKLGSKLREAEQELLCHSVEDIVSALRSPGTFTLGGVQLQTGDFIIEYSAFEGYSGVADKGTQVAITTTITEPLKLEGLARDVVRQVQSARKDAKLDLLDKITLHLSATSPELAKAFGTHRDTITAAVQATRWSDAPLTGDGVHTATVKIDGQPLTIMFRVVKS